VSTSFGTVKRSRDCCRNYSWIKTNQVGRSRRTAKRKMLSKLGKGDKARLETMTEDQRKESARQAAQARWAKRSAKKHEN
jgi:hypothetical protein